ncbi:MAG TPA: HNH endonuclease signature motif containing protein [Chthonomonadaceae bacterium]|nr:HNH endonuclease signature motif containing protein [Chthonomonadaceae bacterium]
MISAELRRTVRTLYAFACGYCGITETEVGAYLTIDHYQPQDAGGSDDISNLVYACHACNLYKSAAWNPQNPSILHPLQIEMHLHVRALPDGTLKGLTPEGTHHIEALHLNRSPMVERRKMRRLIEALLEREAQLRDQELKLDKTIDRKKRAVRKRGRR